MISGHGTIDTAVEAIKKEFKSWADKSESIFIEELTNFS